MTYAEKIEKVFSDDYINVALAALSEADKIKLKQEVSINKSLARSIFEGSQKSALLDRLEAKLPDVDFYKAILEQERKELTKQLLNKSEYYTKIVESMGQEPSQEFKDRAAELWAKFGQTKAQIAALSTVEAAKAFEFPMDDVNDALEFFESLI